MKENISSSLLARFIAGLLFVSVIAGTWDAWWHGAIGRETLFEPPHILLYSAVILAIILGVYGYIKLKDKVWRRLAILLVLVPVSAPFDEIWHRIYGVEDISTIWAVWSPPHIALIVAVIGSLIMLLPIIKKDKDINARRIFGSIVIASILSLFLFLFSPFEPTGPWGIFGFFGAGIISLLIVGAMLFAKYYTKGMAGATLMIIFFVLISSVGFGEKLAEGIIINPHDHAPIWLDIFALLITAFIIDITKKVPQFIKGALAGLIFGGIIYSFSSMFFEPQFQYTFVDGFIAILSSVVGGVLVGIFIPLFYDNKI